MPTPADYVLLSTESYYYYRRSRSGAQPFTTANLQIGAWQPFVIPGDANDGYYTEANGFAATIFRNIQTNEYVIAFRGTDTWKVPGGDLAQNIASGTPDWSILGDLGEGSQTASTLNLVRRLIDSGVNLSQISFTGHSLGGGLAGVASGVYGRPAVISTQLRIIANWMT